LPHREAIQEFAVTNTRYSDLAQLPGEWQQHIDATSNYLAKIIRAFLHDAEPTGGNRFQGIEVVYLLCPPLNSGE
jgi:hypothetical protein